MVEKELIEAIRKGLGECDVMLEGQGCDLTAVIVSNAFQSLSKVKRQQKVYSLINEYLQSGQVHAITLKTWTEEEWREAHG